MTIETGLAIRAMAVSSTSGIVIGALLLEGQKVPKNRKIRFEKAR